MRVVWLDGDSPLCLLFSYGWFKTNRVVYRLACHSFIICFLWLITTGCIAPNGSESSAPTDSDLALTSDIPSKSIEQSTPPLKSADISTDSSDITDSSQESGETKALSEDVRQRFVDAISSDLSQPIETLVIEAVTHQTWPDGCLGLATSDELCTMALVDGWQVTIRHGDTVAIYRSNASGTIVRRAN